MNLKSIDAQTIAEALALTPEEIVQIAEEMELDAKSFRTLAYWRKATNDNLLPGIALAESRKEPAPAFVQSIATAGRMFQEGVAWFLYGYHMEEARLNPRSHSALLLREAAESVLDTPPFNSPQGVPARDRAASRRGAFHRMAEVEGGANPTAGRPAKHHPGGDRSRKSARGTGGVK